MAVPGDQLVPSGVAVNSAEVDLLDQPLMVPAQRPGSDIDLAFAAIMRKRRHYDLLFRYYDGDAPLRYSTRRLREAFGKTFGVYFAENWAAVIIDSMLDRLNLKGFDVAASGLDDRLDKLWEATRLHQESDDVHEGALVCGEAFLIAWREDDGVEAYYNDPRLCHVFYDGDQPTKKAFAAKLWVGDADGKARMVLYYPDRLERYIASGSAVPASGSGFVADEPAREPNPYGEVPVFHFRVRKRPGKIDLDRSVRSQVDAINKLFSDMMVAAEFTALRQRVIISQADPGDLESFKNWWIPAGDGVGQQSQVVELGGAGLENFLKAISETASAIGIITRTPRHYFYASGSDPSGDALLAMEAPLVKKVSKRQEAFAETWVEVAQFLLKLDGAGDVKASDISPTWDPVQSLQPGASATVIKTLTDASVPLVTAVRRAGWAKDEIEQMEKDQADAKKKNSTGLAGAALDAIRAANEQNPNPGTRSVVPGLAGQAGDRPGGQPGAQPGAQPGGGQQGAGGGQQGAGTGGAANSG